MVGEQLGAQLVQGVVGQLGAQAFGEGPQDRPVLLGLALGEDGALAQLHPALGVDVEAGLLGIGGARQDHVGAVRAGVAVGAQIDDEGVGLGDVDLVGAQQEQHVERRPWRPSAPASWPPFARAKPRSRPPTRAAAVCSTFQPFQPSRTTPNGRRAWRRRCSTAAPSAAARAPWPTMIAGFLAAFKRLGEVALPWRGPPARPGRAQVVVVVGQVGLLADDADSQRAGQPALADAGVQHRRFEARIGPDQQDGVGLPRGRRWWS